MDVDSTAISEIDYDAERAKLLVRFTSGERYVYVGVPGEVHRSFVRGRLQGPLLPAADPRPLSVQPAGRPSAFARLSRLAATRRRSALSLMKPAASRWS